MSASYSPLRNNNNLDAPHVPNNIKPKYSTSPLLSNASAPIAKSEIDDDSDDRETVTVAYPGVDDGFFNDEDKNKRINPDTDNVDAKHPDVEIISNHPRNPEPVGPDDNTPPIFDRFDPGDADNPADADKKPNDADDGKRGPADGKSEGPVEPPQPRPRRPSFHPGFGPDIEIGSIPGEFPESIPDVNIYQHKKTLAQGMMDLALFSANANQLRYVVESSNRHPYFFPSIIFISISLILQIAVGIGLIWNARYNVKDRKEICIANKINNFTIIGIFVVTVVNVFISAFGVANPAAT